MAPLLQIWRICGFGLRSMPSRLHLTAIGVFGVAGVSLVLVSMLAMSSGFRDVYRDAQANQRLLVLKQGASSELGSRLEGADVNAVTELIRAVQGPQAGVSAETYFITSLPRRNGAGDVNVPVRGVAAPGHALRPGFRLLSGRLNEPGRPELIVGSRAQRDYAGLELGASVRIGRDSWRVVGVFETEVGVANAEIWGDPALLQQTYDRGSSWQLVVAALSDDAARQALQRLVEADKRLSVKLMTEAEHYAAQSSRVTLLLEGVGTLVAAAMGVVALLVAVSSMQAAVAARRRELAVLRALGFRGLPIVLSVLLEAVLLATAGAAIGGAVAYGLLNGAELSTLNVGGSFTQVPFEVNVGWHTLWPAVFTAVLLGLLAGVLPALAALRGQASDALRRVG